MWPQLSYRDIYKKWTWYSKGNHRFHDHEKLGKKGKSKKLGGIYIKRCYTSIGIPMLNIRQSRDHLIFNMGIPYLGKTLFWDSALVEEQSPSPYHPQQMAFDSVIICAYDIQKSRWLSTAQVILGSTNVFLVICSIQWLECNRSKVPVHNDSVDGGHRLVLSITRRFLKWNN